MTHMCQGHSAPCAPDVVMFILKCCTSVIKAVLALIDYAAGYKLTQAQVDCPNATKESAIAKQAVLKLKVVINELFKRWSKVS